MATMNQPQIEPTGQADFQYLMDDVLLDVWTGSYRDQVTLEGIAVAGTRIDITNILSAAQIRDIRDFCADRLPTRTEAARADAEDAAYQRYADAA